MDVYQIISIIILPLILLWGVWVIKNRSKIRAGPTLLRFSLIGTIVLWIFYATYITPVNLGSFLLVILWTIFSIFILWPSRKR